MNPNWDFPRHFWVGRSPTAIPAGGTRERLADYIRRAVLDCGHRYRVKRLESVTGLHVSQAASVYAVAEGFARGVRDGRAEKILRRRMEQMRDAAWKLEEGKSA